VFQPKFLTPRPNASSELVLLQTQVKNLAKLGNEVFVLTEGAYPPTQIRENVTILPLKGMFSTYSLLLSPIHRAIPYFSDIFSLDIIGKAIRKLNKELDVDVIYTCGSPFSSVFSTIIANATGIPIVSYISHYPSSKRWWGRDIDMLKGYKLPLTYLIHQIFMDTLREVPRREFIQKWGLRHTKRFIVSSNYIKGILYHLGVDSKRIEVVYPGVDIPSLREDFKQPNMQVVTYFGHFWQGRGVLDLVKAFLRVHKKHSNLKLMIAASNVHKLTELFFKELINSWELNGPNIMWKNVVSDLYLEVLNQSTAIVLPYRDMPSMKLIESMAYGKTIITTKIGWTGELISDAISGFLVDVGDVMGIVEKLDFILNNPELAEEVGRNARESAKLKCDSYKNAKLIESILKETTRRD